MKQQRNNDFTGNNSFESEQQAERGIGMDMSDLPSPPLPEIDDSHLNSVEHQIIKEKNEQLNNAIVRTGEKSFQLRNFTMSLTSLTIPENTSPQDFDFLGDWLSSMETASNWWRGAWANFETRDITGESDESNKERNQKYQELAIRFEINEKTLRNCAYVERKVTPSRRRDGLSFSHHAEVAGLDPEDQEYYLNLADESGLSVAKLRAEIKRENSPEDEKTALTPLKHEHVKQAKFRESIKEKFAKASKPGKKSWIEFTKDQARFWSEFAERLDISYQNEQD